MRIALDRLSRRLPVALSPDRVSAVLVLMAMSCSAEPPDDGGAGGRSDGGKGGMGATNGFGGANGVGGASGNGSGGVIGSNGNGGGGPGGSGPGGSGGMGGGGGVGGDGGIGAVGGIAGNAGTEGSAGTAGDAGTAGVAGSAGTAGAAGTAGTAGAAGTGGAPTAGCTPAPTGTFQTRSMTGGPNNAYTIVRPTTLGQNGFKHPPVAWGNGLGTQPPLYANSLNQLASNGFVVIANPGPGSDPQVVRQGLEWLIAQNASGEYADKLAVNCAGTIGYSMGGGAAVGSGSHPAVKAIVSIHGLQDAAERASGPILLLTSEGDTFVTKSGFVLPCYNRSSRQPTILASHTGGDHLDPIAGTTDFPPAIAWLRYWLYGDQAQRDWFFGMSCKLCSWPDIRRKNHTW